jgi:hydroxyacylglutathione hydrolase
MGNLQYHALTLGELETNCYIVWDDHTNDAVIVDPAASGDFIVDQVLTRQLNPTAIWLTHGHFDHVLGLLEVATAFAVPIWMHNDDTFLLAQAAQSAHHWTGITPDPVPPANQFWQDHDQLWVGDHQFTVLHTPGHTPGSVSLYSPENDVLISGDTLFKGTVGRTDFSYSDVSAMKKSLARLLELPAATLVLPGHGEPTVIRNEQSLAAPTF